MTEAAVTAEVAAAVVAEAAAAAKIAAAGIAAVAAVRTGVAAGAGGAAGAGVGSDSTNAVPQHPYGTTLTQLALPCRSTRGLSRSSSMAMVRQ